MSMLFPLYLLGLLGLALPWLLHRFSHHEPPEQAFPTTRFLEPTRPPATSKRQLRHWPLLALRVLFLALLCFLFSQPWLRAQNDAANAEAVQLIIVDNSFSMRAGDRWQQVQSELDDAMGSMPDKDAVQLFSFAGQLRAHTDIVNDRSSVNSALSQIEPGYESADYGELMRYLNKVASEIDMPVSATFITDAQRANLPVQINALLANRLKQFQVISVDSSTPINYSLSAEARTSDAVNARVSVRLSASDVMDKSTAEVVLKTVQIKAKDRVVASQAVELSAGESKTIVFDAVSLPSESDAVFTVGFAQPDFLSDDDQLEIPVRGLSLVDFTMTYIGSEPSQQAQVFVKTALETNGDARVSILDINTALAPTVRHAAVFVDDLASVPDTVTRFVMDGGNVLLLPSTSSASSNDALATNASGITRVDQAHPLGLGDIDWFDAGFYSTINVSLTSDDRVLLGLDSGEPLLIERDMIDAGRLLMLNESMDGFSSDLPLQPSFVVLMQQIIQYFNASNALPVELDVGKTLYLPANSQVLDPDGEPMLELAQLGGANDIRLPTPGLYTVLGANSTDTVSAVLGAAESNLLGLERDELDAWEARHDTKQNSNAEQDNTELVQAIEQTDKQTLWRWLLPAVLLFLLIESLLANRMLWVRRDGL